MALVDPPKSRQQVFEKRQNGPFSVLVFKKILSSYNLKNIVLNSARMCCLAFLFSKCSQKLQLPQQLF